MRRPLCCVCAAFVVTVFLYLQINPAPLPQLCLEQGSRVTLQGRVVQKYTQEEALVLQLDCVSIVQTKQKIDGRVLCYIEQKACGIVPKAGFWICVRNGLLWREFRLFVRRLRVFVRFFPFREKFPVFVRIIVRNLTKLSGFLTISGFLHILLSKKLPVKPCVFHSLHRQFYPGSYNTSVSSAAACRWVELSPVIRTSKSET